MPPVRFVRRPMHRVCVRAVEARVSLAIASSRQSVYLSVTKLCQEKCRCYRAEKVLVLVRNYGQTTESQSRDGKYSSSLRIILELERTQIPSVLLIVSCNAVYVHVLGGDRRRRACRVSEGSFWFVGAVEVVASCVSVQERGGILQAGCIVGRFRYCQWWASLRIWRPSMV